MSLVVHLGWVALGGAGGVDVSGDTGVRGLDPNNNRRLFRKIVCATPPSVSEHTIRTRHNTPSTPSNTKRTIVSVVLHRVEAAPPATGRPFPSAPAGKTARPPANGGSTIN